MKRSRLRVPKLTLAVLTGMAVSASSAFAQAPIGVMNVPPPAAVGPPVTTIWQRLGISQGMEATRNRFVNPRGNRPNLEAKPPLRRIADPINLASDNPAIKAAAKIKADADLAPQKIKAIKYLGTVCCGCAKEKDEVKGALLAALDDCTEEVRYSAAIALCECAGNRCAACNTTGCCDPVIMNKLLKMSEGKDAQGCYLEPSARVRAVAGNALNRCRAVTAPTTPEPGTETPPATETPRLAPQPGSEQPAVPPTQAPAVPVPGSNPPPPPTPTTSLEPPALNSAASATQIRIVSPATYTEPMVKPGDLPRQWPAAAAMLDARWQRPIAAHRTE